MKGESTFERIHRGCWTLTDLAYMAGSDLMSGQWPCDRRQNCDLMVSRRSLNTSIKIASRDKSVSIFSVDSVFVQLDIYQTYLTRIALGSMPVVCDAAIPNDGQVQ